MRRDRAHPAGTIVQLRLDCRLLAGNLMGDPTERRIDVYLPAGHDGRDLPLLVDLVGFTAGGPVHTNWRAYTENVPERLDRLIGSGAMPPVVVAFPDCYMRLGGNQYVDSAATGPWARVLIEEMVPFVETRFGCGGQARRGVFGKSSGGYGSMVHAMRHGGEVWAAAACHSGDSAFELSYLHEMPGVLRTIAKKGSIRAVIEAVEAAPKPSGADTNTLMAFAMAATYDPDPTQFLGVRLPVTLDTCELIADRWANWLRWDPVNIVEERGVADRLKRMKALYIDCGDVDQYNLVYGARRVRRRLEALGVPHRYEEFPDDHSSVDYRMDVSLPYIAKALAEGA